MKKIILILASLLLASPSPALAAASARWVLLVNQAELEQPEPCRAAIVEPEAVEASLSKIFPAYNVECFVTPVSPSLAVVRCSGDDGDDASFSNAAFFFASKSACDAKFASESASFKAAVRELEQKALCTLADKVRNRMGCE